MKRCWVLACAPELSVTVSVAVTSPGSRVTKPNTDWVPQSVWMMWFPGRSSRQS